MAVMSSTTVSTSPSAASMDESINVSISGVLFSLDQPTFDKLRKLPWQTDEATSSSANDDDDDDDVDCPVASYSLSTSPELFDILVHHVLFGTLPPSMAEHDMEELEIMALSLGLQGLAQHLQVAQPRPSRRSGKKTLSTSANYKVSAVRSWAAVKRWSSAGALVKKAKNKTKKKTNKDAQPPLQTHLFSTTRHLA